MLLTGWLIMSPGYYCLCTDIAYTLLQVLGGLLIRVYLQNLQVRDLNKV